MMKIRLRYVIGCFVSFVTIFSAVALDYIGSASQFEPLVLNYSRSVDLKAGEIERLNAFIGRTIGENRLQYHVLGHTGERGDSAANLELSRERAAQVASLLREAGVSEDRISFAGGVGAAEPLAALPDESESARQRRMARVVVTVVGRK